MKVGFLTAILNDRPLEEVLDLAKETGYDAVEIAAWPWSRHISPREAAEGKAEEILGKVHEKGLTISALTCHVNHIHPDSSEREKLNEHFRWVIRAAGAMKVPVVTAVSGVPLSDLDETQNWELFKGIMGEHLKAAEEVGVKIAIETFPPFMVHNIPTIERMFNELPQESLGLNFDPSHFVWQGVDYLEAVRRFGDRIFHSHAKDTEILDHILRLEGVMGKGWWRFRIPGFGQVNWKALISTYREVGYDYVISFEHEDPLFGPEEGVRKTARFLRELVK